MSKSFNPEKLGEFSRSGSGSRRRFLKTPQFSDDDETRMKNSQTSTKEAGFQNMILPKIISLAARLVPAVARSMGDGLDEIPESEEKMNHYLDLQSNELDADDSYNRAAEGLTTPQLKMQAKENVDVESGLRVPSAIARAALSPKAEFHDWGQSPVSPFAHASASTQVSPPSPSVSTPNNHLNHPESPNVSVENIAAGIEQEYQLRQREADELLALIIESNTPASKKNRITSPEAKPAFDSPSPPPSLPFAEADETIEYESEGEFDDDDDLNIEMLRLNDVTASLRSEMQGLQFETLPTFQVSPENRQTRRRWRFPSFPRPNHSLSSISFAGSEDAALQLKTFRTYFGSSGIDYNNRRDGVDYISSESMHALYWAIAMVWAVVILLAGHFEFNGFNTWKDVLNWLFHL